MPVKTKRYFLEFFIQGDGYLSISDRRRFSTVDNQLNRIAEIIQDGRIDGWEVLPLDFPFIKLTAGSGLINKFYVNSFDDKILELSDNGNFYIYAQRRSGIIGAFGPKSDVRSIDYIDSGAPSAPSGLLAQSAGPFSVTLDWNDNIEADLSHYEIKRSSNGVFVLIASVEQSSYQDIVDEDALYEYKVYAVDKSGNISDPITTSVITPLDTAIPPNPTEVLMIASEAAINILWKKPASIPIAKIDHFEIEYVELNTDDTKKINTRLFVNSNKYALSDRIDNLKIGQKYKITIRAIDIRSRESSGISMNVITASTPAPRDPQAIVYALQESLNGIRLNLSWTDGDDPYDPATTYRYRIYITVDGEPESLGIDVPIGFNEEQISLYTFDLVEYFSIPANKIVTARITSLDQAGFESLGNYIRIETTSTQEPLRIRDLSSSFNQSNGSIDITWRNQTDTGNIQIIILQDDLEDAYIGDEEIINTTIGKAERYVYTPARLNTKYTIRVIPISIDGIVGSASTTVSLSNIPGGLALPDPPARIESKTNDRQVVLTWDRSVTTYTTQYRLYRKSGNITLNSSDWELWDTIPVSINSFQDFGLNNDEVYSYYVTSVDIYGRESLHLINEAYNLNFIEATPFAEGNLTQPEILSINLNSFNQVVLTWEALLEEFDAFIIYRSIGNKHSWKKIATLTRDTFLYTDIELPLIDGTVFYYTIDKSINDSDIVLQTTDIAPQNSIFLARVLTKNGAITDIDISDRRDIQDLADPLGEYTDRFLLPHKHKGVSNEPDRIDLSSEFIVTDWSTVDGRIFTTAQNDINGTSFVVKINGRFPSVFYTVDAPNRRLVFSEPIIEINPITGEGIGETPSIEVKVLGVEEVDGILDNTRFNNLHARQVKLDELKAEQLPGINHEGRIKEKMMPKKFLLEKYSNYTFIVPPENIDSTKNFGDGTTFYCTASAQGDINQLFDFDLSDDGVLVGFNKPEISATTSNNIKSGSLAEVVSDPSGFKSSKCYHLQFEFIDSNPNRWVRVITSGSDIVNPNPIIDLRKRLRLKVMVPSGSIYLSIGIRETNSLPESLIGSDGGIVGPVEWVGVTSVNIDDGGNKVPIGMLIESSPDWQEIDINLPESLVVSFENGNSILNRGLGVLEHLAFTIVPDSENSSGPFDIYIDEIEQVSDLLVSGTSQGLQISRDFGRTWNISRLTETPVHRFYKANNNVYLWAISADKVFLSTDPTFWFSPGGLAGIQFIHDITEDSSGNIFVSTDRGVYRLDISLINHYSSFKQTQPVNAFTTDCYGLYCNNISSGLEEIWVSTEIGIYKTIDNGNSWQNTGMETSGLVVYEFINIGGNINPTVIGTTRKHVIRKLKNDTGFFIIADLENQHGVFDIWKMEYFNTRLYISTGSGVFINTLDELFTSGVTSIPFEKVFDGNIDFNGVTGIAFGLDAIDLGEQGEQLFIGQENRLMVSLPDNSVSLKKEYRNKEIPSFFINSDETNIGFIYNAFNGVVVFREPRLVTDIIYASHLPRKTYIAINQGWSQTNPQANVFVYKNGLPTWLDWRLDNNAILGELQIINGKLNNLPELNGFNSLFPSSQEFLQLCLQDIQSIFTGGENNSVLLNNDTIIKFLDDYTRFLTLIIYRFVIDNDLDLPRIFLAGINRLDRTPGSRAELLEQMEEFQADDSLGITIDTVTGAVDFLQAFASSTNPNRRELLSFNKFDNLQISVFNSNVKNTGEFTHRQIEDKFEDINTGLTSELSTITSANLIKAGIFLERQHNFMFSRFKVSNVQSKFFSSVTNDWYDKLNSTIDYDTIIQIKNMKSARFANAVLTVTTEDPYFLTKIWIATDVSISEHVIDFDGKIELTNIIKPPDFTENIFVYDMCSHDDLIYIVLENKLNNKFYIYTTGDLGSTWSRVSTVNLPEKIYSISFLNGNFVVSTERGVFYSDNSIESWFNSSVNLSNGLNNSDAVIAFNKGVNIYQDTFLVAESNRWFYTSGQGIEFLALGRISNNNCTVVNKILRFKNLTYVATDRGLYNDGNSLLSNSVQFGLETGLEDSAGDSVDLTINDIAAGDSALYCCSSNGKIYRFFDSGDGRGNIWKRYTIPNFGPIHKIHLVESGDNNDYLVCVSYNLIKSVDVTPETGVFE